MNTYVKKRNEIAKLYTKLLNKNFFDLPKFEKGIYSSFHLFVVRIKVKNFYRTREKLFNFLRRKKILVNMHYIPIHHHPYYRKLGFYVGQYPISEKHANSAISLPVFPSLKFGQVKKIVKIINSFIKNAN